MRNLFTALGVSVNDTPEAIEEAYLMKLLKCSASEVNYLLLGKAYRTLTNPHFRQDHEIECFKVALEVGPSNSYSPTHSVLDLSFQKRINECRRRAQAEISHINRDVGVEHTLALQTCNRNISQIKEACRKATSHSQQTLRAKISSVNADTFCNYEKKYRIVALKAWHNKENVERHGVTSETISVEFSIRDKDLLHLETKRDHLTHEVLIELDTLIQSILVGN